VVARFNATAQRPELAFHAVFSRVREPDRSWDVNEAAWKFPARYLGWFKVPLGELRRLRPDVFVLEYDRWNLALGAVAGFALAQRVAFRVLPNYDAWSKRRWWREIGKSVLFKAVDGAKVPGPDGAALARRYGLPPERATMVTQSIDLAHYGRAGGWPAAERQRYRAALGLTGCAFLYVGRIWAGKGLDELFAAYRHARGTRADISLLVVGDGIDYPRYAAQEQATPGVTFAGFVQPADLPEMYAACDVLVFPTHGDPNGLVVEEALAAGLPVIASDAAGDISSRVPQAVGRIVPVGNARALANAMEALAEPSVRAPMADRAAGSVAGRDDERYATDFVRFASGLMARPARRTAHRLVGTVIGRLLAGRGRPAR
jgi:glycosyltransferase involved in cell wall biosynthesis